MIRLLAVAADSRWKDVAARLAGVAIETSRGLLDSCAGIILAGSERFDKDAIEEWLHAGKHVLHIGAPEAEWQSLWETARQHHVQFLALNPDRYLPSRQLIKQMLPDKLGEAGLIRMHRWLAATSRDLLLRDLDTALWLTSRSPNCVYALQQADGAFGQIHLGFPGGGMALIDVDCRLPPGDAYQSLSVIGSFGAAYADDHQNAQLVYRGGHPQAVQTEEGIKHTVAMIAAFADAIRSGRDASESAAAWCEVFTVAAAVEESLRTRQAVHREGR